MSAQRTSARTSYGFSPDVKRPAAAELMFPPSAFAAPIPGAEDDPCMSRQKDTELILRALCSALPQAPSRRALPGRVRLIDLGAWSGQA